MKTALIFITVLLSTLGISAQNARTILDNASKAYNDAGGITANFTLDTEEVNNKMTYSQDGKAYLKGNKFMIDVPDGITWFDGKTQWVYSKGSDEVNVSEPTGEELAGISPAVLLNIYKTGFKLNYIGEETEKGKKVYVVEMVPENKKTEFSKMRISIDKATNIFTSVKMFGKNNVNNILYVTNLKTKQTLADNTFVFDKNKYQNIEIIDLR